MKAVTDRPTRSQARATCAWERVNRLVGGAADSVRDAASKGGDAAEYARFAKRFPALLQSSGLCQAIAFARAKAERAQLCYIEHLAATMGLPGAESLEQASRTVGRAEYLRLTREAFAAAGWLARYSEALIGGETP